MSRGAWRSGAGVEIVGVEGAVGASGAGGGAGGVGGWAANRGSRADFYTRYLAVNWFIKHAPFAE